MPGTPVGVPGGAGSDLRSSMPTPSQPSPRTPLDLVIDGFAIVSGVTLCALTVLICADVAVRFSGAFTIPWSLEVAEYSLLIVTFLGAPWVLANGGHISIDIVVERLAATTRRRVLRSTHAIGTVVCGVLLVYSAGAWWNSYSDGTMVHQTLVFPEWLLYSVPPPVFLMLTAIFLRWLRLPPGTPGASASSGGL